MYSVAQVTGTFTDTRDGKVYKTVTIGTQTWMAENLAYKTEDTGNLIGSQPAASVSYGYYYRWDAALKASPQGWHLPTDAEWTTLINYLGGNNVAGNKLKTTTDWNLKNGTNESGFNALPADSYYGGVWGTGSNAYFWSSTESSSGRAWMRGLNVYNAQVSHTDDDELFGLSVRCIKDN